MPVPAWTMVSFPNIWLVTALIWKGRGLKPRWFSRGPWAFSYEMASLEGDYTKERNGMDGLLLDRDV
ncbi:hypothetical protein CC2G_007008 [Coprinopsis cinerea AmutBmut pab1-1]|nr:hypothetical protein CC2G_007008 [Coprinopsis cinerea AmutBmut pab1-1]